MASPKFFQQFNLDTNMNNNPDHFIIDDLLDFSNDDDTFMTDASFDSFPGNSADSSTVTTAVESCISSSDPTALADIASRNISDTHFSGDLCVPYDDIAELEWLSNFVEESFSSEDPQRMELIPGLNVLNDDVSEAHWFKPEPTIVEPTIESPILNPEVPAPPKVPAKARSKRTRGPPGNWASRLHILAPPPLSPFPSPFPSPSPSGSSEEPPEVIHPTPVEPSPSPVVVKKPAKANPKKKESNDGSSDGRRCLHCATDKTPQWRTGPLGPKTLCNACGVRFKSGRLVPEYRPAASPTFVLTKHSNSHRKVLELRRQKEMVRVPVHQQSHHHQHPQQFLQQHHQHQQHQNMMFDVSNGDDYLIHEQVGLDFRQLMQ